MPYFAVVDKQKKTLCITNFSKIFDNSKYVFTLQKKPHVLILFKRYCQRFEKYSMTKFLYPLRIAMILLLKWRNYQMLSNEILDQFEFYTFIFTIKIYHHMSNALRESRCRVNKYKMSYNSLDNDCCCKNLLQKALFIWRWLQYKCLKNKIGAK